MLRNRLAGAVILCALSAPAGPALAQSNKCTINGKVLYTDGNCSTGARQETVRGPDPRSPPPSPSSQFKGAEDVPRFAARLYEVSVYTAEEETLKAMVAAEVELVASRWLAKKISVSDPTIRSRLPARWEDMLGQMRNALAPVVESHLRERANALRAAGLEGRAPYIQEYQQLIRASNNRGNIRFADGSTAEGAGSDQLADMREILAFHDTPAAAKWRRLWPELRIYGAQMTALQYRVMADPTLGPASGWNERARVLMKRVGGQVLEPGEWQAMANDRLGFTMSGLGRFLLPLGTEMRTEGADGSSTTIDGRGPSVVITQMDGPQLSYRLLDNRWSGEISRRLSQKELKQIDDALTASYVEAKGRWFAPLEIDFDGYYNVAKRLRASREMRHVYQSFNSRSAEAMGRVWDEWQRK